MKHSSGPAPGPLPIVSVARPRPEIMRFEYTRHTKAACSLAWETFAEIRNWRRFSDAYSRIEWQGLPWVPGSRLQIDIVKPVVATQDRVITICTPPRSVAWINHVLGYSMEQWVQFDPVDGGTRVSTWLEITGADFRNGEVERYVPRILETWYVNFCAGCDEAAQRR